ncbi:hypothetical protein JGH11_12110 [Dysgonomonas sp. Marseille-P4677]|uniref:hypothetical protein n=1 Tax=Dysgonomonas sp. Marseille-P4677 TaxID=2364790 RepID=UPI0019122367|nr:hypothetical protein [Dysgonomonas sp. Marseille-P4677]MBK5721615.1 hypothetical protein [Dysgonomonas sp. Marseille-P4677]
MKFKSILAFILLVCTTFSVSAQNRRGGFDIAALKKEKSEFLKKELNLTEAESKAFLPLESEFMSKKYEVNRDARRETRALKQKQNKTDEDYKRITQLNLESEQKEAQIQMEYYKKFSEVLSAEKIEKYRSVDLKFKEMMLKRHKERHQEGSQRK